MSIKQVFFGTTAIQKSRRIALDSNLLATLGLEEGDSVSIALDVQTETILITKGKQKQRAAKAQVGAQRNA